MRSRSQWRRNGVIWLALALALFVAYEVGVRMVTPDAVQYEIVTVQPAGPGSTQSGTITDPATIAQWRAAMTAHPTKSLSDAYFSAWGGTGCSVGTVEHTTVRFTWHGLPVEVVSPGPGCALMSSEVWRGGLPDPQIYLVNFDTLPKH